MKRLLLLLMLAGLLFGQDVIKLKNGKVYYGQYFGELNGKIIFKITGESESKTFIVEDVLSVNKSKKNIEKINDDNLLIDRSVDYSNIKKDQKNLGDNNNLTDPDIGIGLGAGTGGLSASFLYDAHTYFGMFGVTLLNGRNEDNSYDFSPNLFDDSDEGEIYENAWIAGGLGRNISNDFSLYFGGGINIRNKYFKRYDSSEILGAGDGKYYVKDDNAKSISQVFALGMSQKFKENKNGINKYSLFAIMPYEIHLLVIF